MTEHPAVTMTEIAELAQVKRPTVSNWRRRHEDFPPAAGGDTTQPLFDTEQVAEWLERRPLPTVDVPTVDDAADAPRSYGDVFRVNLSLRGLSGTRGDDESVRTAVALAARCAELGRALTAQEAPEAGRLLGTVNDLVDSLGPARAVERLIGTADRDTSTLWAYATPAPVAELIARLAGDVTGRSVCDPAVGVGDLLVRVLNGHTPAKLTAADLNGAVLTTLRHRLRCHGVLAELTVGDSLANWPVDAPDVVVLDPPFVSGEKQAGSNGPMWWASGAADHLAPGGHAYVVVPTWTLTREPATRARLVRDAALRAIVQLPRRAHAFRTGTELALLELVPPGEAGADVVLCDAEKIARRKGERWPETAAKLVRNPATASSEECRTVSARELAIASSWLPAQRLAPTRDAKDQVRTAIAARGELHRAFGAQTWVRDLDVAEERPEPARRSLLDVAIIVGGHRIADQDIEAEPAELGRSCVIGLEELRGDCAVGSRSADNLVLGRYESLQRTRPGDVIVFAERGVHTLVDEVGGRIVRYPAQIVRPRSDRDGVLVPSRVLASMLIAPVNVGRESGSLVRRVSLRSMTVPYLSVEELVRLESFLAELEKQRNLLKDRLAAVDGLERVVTAGVADGALRVVKAPEKPRAMMEQPVPRRDIEEI